MRLKKLALVGAVILGLMVMDRHAHALAARKGDSRAEIETAMKAYAGALREKDAGKLAALFTPDGEILNPGTDAVRGPDQIRRFIGSFGEVRIEAADMVSGSIELLSEDATQWGTYTQRAMLPGQTTALNLSGRFVAQWKKQADGRWLLRRMLTQPNP